jgi:hypothetical protein
VFLEALQMGIQMKSQVLLEQVLSQLDIQQQLINPIHLPLELLPPSLQQQL